MEISLNSRKSRLITTVAFVLPLFIPIITFVAIVAHAYIAKPTTDGHLVAAYYFIFVAVPLFAIVANFALLLYFRNSQQKTTQSFIEHVGLPKLIAVAISVLVWAVVFSFSLQIHEIKQQVDIRSFHWYRETRLNSYDSTLDYTVYTDDFQLASIRDITLEPKQLSLEINEFEPIPYGEIRLDLGIASEQELEIKSEGSIDSISYITIINVRDRSQNAQVFNDFEIENLELTDGGNLKVHLNDGDLLCFSDKRLEVTVLTVHQVLWSRLIVDIAKGELNADQVKAMELDSNLLVCPYQP